MDQIRKFLESCGIKNTSEVLYNLSFGELFKHEIDPSLEGNERGTLTEFGAVIVDTGKYTGRSPKDKYIVEEDSSKHNVWWGAGSALPISNNSDNKKMSLETWKHVRSLAMNQLTAKRLYVMDGFCGSNPDTRISVRLVTEVAWMAHFFKCMFIRPAEEELINFKPDWTVFNACKAKIKDYENHKMRSEVGVAFNIKERSTVILGTWYGGEIKKGIFSMMNYFLPLKGIGSFHCSANMGNNGDVAIFFGLSGTGKTTLSADPKRLLIGDDEHGWDQDGIFNFEGGCYAKCIGLSEEKEWDIYHAIRRDALLENVKVDENGRVDFNSSEKTENTRAAYPIYHINNIVKPVSKGGHAKHIIFLTCDAFGVLPPVSKLTNAQAMYHYLSGYTAKVAGTELGIMEPQSTFSACFGQAFLLLHPMKYAEILGKKMEEHGSKAYLVNTGWTGGRYGIGHRISIPDTRKIIDSILDGTIEKGQFDIMPVFNLQIPKNIPGVNPSILHPRNTWEDKKNYDEICKQLAEMFIAHFENFLDDPRAKELVSAGPSVS